MASTVLPNGIIIPEKYSRDWYADLYHNWQELDNLLGGGTPKDGTLTIQKNGTTVGTFSANQATDETVNITVPDVNDATLTIQQNGTTVDTFTANSSTDKTVDITVPTKTSDLTNDSNFVQSSDLATVATSGSYNDLDNKPTIPTVNNATLTIQKNGTTVDTFTANSSTDKTVDITVPTKTSDLNNDSGFITEDDTKIPLAGSNQISGDLIPSTDGTVNLGSVSYQWNNAYIKSLTINGVACGDILTHNASEFVNVSSDQTIGGRKNFNIVSAADTVISRKYVNFNGNTNIYISGGKGWNLGGQISLVGKGNVTRDDGGNIVTDGGDVVLRCTSNLCGIFDAVLNVNNSIKEPQFSPTHNKINLGTSTNKWKSFNGINPGALSLPGASVNVDTTNWVLDGSNVNIFTPTSDGWFGIQCIDTVYDQMHYVFVGRIGSGSTYYQQNIMSSVSALWDSKYHGCVFIPVLKGVTYHVRCVCGSVVATLYPCQGNV